MSKVRVSERSAREKRKRKSLELTTFVTFERNLANSFSYRCEVTEMSMSDRKFSENLLPCFVDFERKKRIAIEMRSRRGIVRVVEVRVEQGGVRKYESQSCRF